VYRDSSLEIEKIVRWIRPVRIRAGISA